MQKQLPYRLGYLFSFATTVFATTLMAVPAEAQIEFRAKPISVGGVITPESNDQTIVLKAKVPVFAVTRQWVQETRTCSTVVCTDALNDGSRGDWKGFFTVPRDKKATKLAEAILGIGPVTAVKIVESNRFFLTIPRTWSEFTLEIKTAERYLLARGYDYRFSEQVLELHGAENSKNLGYAGENNCQVVQRPCTVWVEREFERFAYEIDRTISVTVTGAILQNFEKDEFAFSVGMAPADVRLAKAGEFNEYQARIQAVSNSETKAELIATKRNRFDLPSSAGSIQVVKNGENYKILGSVNPQYLPNDSDSGSQLQLIYRVCRNDWFGGCYEERLPYTALTVQTSTFETQFPSTVLKRGSKHKVWFKFVRVGSRFYSSDGYVRTTDTFKGK